MGKKNSSSQHADARRNMELLWRLKKQHSDKTRRLCTGLITNELSRGYRNERRQAGNRRKRKDQIGRAHV